MKRIDEFLNQWIHNSIVRETLRKLIIEYARSAFEEGRGPEGFGDYS